MSDHHFTVHIKLGTELTENDRARFAHEAKQRIGQSLTRLDDAWELEEVGVTDVYKQAQFDQLPDPPREEVVATLQQQLNEIFRRLDEKGL